MPELNDGSIAYLALKAAHKRYGKSPSVLQGDELKYVQSLAQHQRGVEACVLAAIEARDVVVPEASLAALMSEIRGRYPGYDEFTDDLARNGMDEAAFKTAVERELKVSAILEKVATRAVKVSEVDIELYYLYHAEQFRRPETRLARHILLTINKDYAENTREAAEARILEIAGRLVKDPSCFEEQALKYSECPTALQGGELGDLPHGKLYPELDEVLFKLPANGISAVVESPLGFHILRCDAITEAAVLSREQASPRIRALLEQKRRRACQRAWVKQLQEKA
ncbi:MAG: nitrogen fixation protein NifM [Gallionella sp.]|nr:nitrogen fixation protein NifM [Gallionella sp.]